jgi:hypothetical protein
MYLRLILFTWSKIKNRPKILSKTGRKSSKNFVQNFWTIFFPFWTKRDKNGPKIPKQEENSPKILSKIFGLFFGTIFFPFRTKRDENGPKILKTGRK